MPSRAEELMQRILGIAVDPNRILNRALDAIRDRGIGSYEWRVELGAVDRPAYAYCVRDAARLASRLEMPRISVVEFGVANGDGLLALERHAQEWSKAYGVEIEVYGFDSGHGLPVLSDYRDLPYHWQQGFFEMDQDKLLDRLQLAQLVIGDIDDTLPTFVNGYDPAPIAAVMYDMDLYSSTTTGLRIFDTDEKFRMPRTLVYLDDIIGNGISLFSDYTGERLAIAEFNDAHPTQKISPAYNLLCRATREWHHQIFVTHDFAHARYNDFVSWFRN